MFCSISMVSEVNGLNKSAEYQIKTNSDQMLPIYLVGVAESLIQQSAIVAG